MRSSEAQSQDLKLNHSSGKQYRVLPPASVDHLSPKEVSTYKGKGVDSGHTITRNTPASSSHPFLTENDVHARCLKLVQRRHHQHTPASHPSGAFHPSFSLGRMLCQQGVQVVQQ